MYSVAVQGAGCSCLGLVETCLAWLSSSQLWLFMNQELHVCCYNTVQELVEDFVFTSSKVLLQCRRNQGDIQQLDQAVPVCQTQATVMATFELLVYLSTGCLPNLRTLAEMLTSMYYTGKLILLIALLPHQLTSF